MNELGHTLGHLWFRWSWTRHGICNTHGYAQNIYAQRGTHTAEKQAKDVTKKDTVLCCTALACGGRYSTMLVMMLLIVFFFICIQRCLSENGKPLCHYYVKNRAPPSFLSLSLSLSFCCSSKLRDFCLRALACVYPVFRRMGTLTRGGTVPYCGSCLVVMGSIGNTLTVRIYMLKGEGLGRTWKC